MPRGLNFTIISLIHKGHSDISELNREAKQTVFWPNVFRDIQEKYEQCISFKMGGKNGKPNLPPAEVISWPKLNSPNEELHMQHFTPT